MSLPSSPPPTAGETAAAIAALLGGYTATELAAAFNMVAPAPNWKAPIAATLPLGANTALIKFAIAFYTGGGATFVRRPGSWSVTAPGYYASVGA